MSLRNKLLEDMLDCCEVLGTNLDELKADELPHELSRLRWCIVVHIHRRTELYTLSRMAVVFDLTEKSMKRIYYAGMEAERENPKFKIQFEDFEVNLLLHKAKKSLAA